MKLSELQILHQGLVAIGGQKLPFKLGWAIARTQRIVTPIMEDLEKSRVALAEEHAEKDADGKPVMLDGGSYDIRDMPAFSKAWAAHLETDEDVKLYMAKLVEFEKLEIEPAILYSLSPMIEEGETKPEKAKPAVRAAKGKAG